MFSFSFWTDANNNIILKDKDGAETIIDTDGETAPEDIKERFDWCISKLLAKGLIPADGEYNYGVSSVIKPPADLS